MNKWTLSTWATAILLAVCGAAAFFVLGFALRMSGEPYSDSLSDPVATAQVERLEDCLDCESELHALQTRIPPVETREAELGATAIALQTACASTPTPRPTMTPDVLPTLTPVPTVPVLCRPCLANSRECPAGYVCAQCRAGMWRCVPSDNVNASCQKCVQNIGAFPDVPSNGTPMPVTVPIWSMTGLAVWNEDTTETASGVPFDSNAMAGAVDANMKYLIGSELKLSTIPGYGVNEARSIVIRCNDVGPLFAEETFVYESRPRGKWSVQRWWPGDGDGALPIVVDLTKEAMNQLTGGSRETCAITMTIVE